MNDTGTKITARLSVVARTAMPISAVACFAARKESMPFSSTCRKMFSSTMIASSITIPTISTSASMVTLFSVKPRASITPNVEITDTGIAMAAITVLRQLRSEQQHHKRSQNAAEHEVKVDLVQRGL